MKHWIIFLLVTFAASVHGQKYDWRRGIVRGSTFALAGGVSGLHEGLQHPQTYTGFKRIFPRANDSFWNPSLSWKRKYDNPYPLSATFPMFTDAYHLTNAVRTIGLIGSTTYIVIGQKRPWWHYGIDLLIGGTFYSIGTNGVYQYLKHRSR